MDKKVLLLGGVIGILVIVASILIIIKAQGSPPPPSTPPTPPPSTPPSTPPTPPSTPPTPPSTSPTPSCTGLLNGTPCVNDGTDRYGDICIDEICGATLNLPGASIFTLSIQNITPEDFSQAVEDNFKNELASQLDISVNRIIITELRGGSVNIDILLLPLYDANGAISEVPPTIDEVASVLNMVNVSKHILPPKNAFSKGGCTPSTTNRSSNLL